MKNRSAAIILTVFFVTAFASASYAMCGHNGYGKKGGGYHNGGYNCMTTITDKERDALKKQRIAFLDETRDLRIKIFSKKMELEKELTKNKPNPTKVTTLRNHIYSINKELSKIKTAHMKKINEIIPGFMHTKNQNKLRDFGECPNIM